MFLFDKKMAVKDIKPILPYTLIALFGLQVIADQVCV